MTTEKVDNEADDLLDDIYDESAPEHSILSQREFKPWHKPRKHWVRINQLCKLTQKLIAETHFQDLTLRYLTLPGEELLDVQAIGNITKEGFEELLDVQALQGAVESGKKTPLKLKYIGFNNVGNNKERLAAQEYAEGILADTGTIDQASRILNDQVQQIANKNSLACRTVWDNGPYNLINLDLCDSVANRPPDHEAGTYFDAIGEIIDLQRLHMAQPFILFISTRTALDDINSSSLKKIVSLYNHNFTMSDVFKAKFEELVEETSEELLKRLCNGEDVLQESLNKIFGVGLGKWLLQLVKPNTPQWDVSLEHLCCYSISDDRPNMLSLAFKFTKVDGGMLDKVGLIQPRKIAKIQKTEIDLALSMLDQSRLITDIDKLLRDDEEQRNKIIKQAGRLLANAGYSEEGYVKWAN